MVTLRLLVATAAVALVLTFGIVSGPTANAAGPTPVDLLTADSFGVLAGAGITNAGETTIIGDVGSFPTTSQTGFGSCPAINCVNLTGTNHGGDTVTQGAKTDLVTAYNQAASYPRTTIPTELGPSTPNPLVPGVYTSASTTFQITGTLTLDAGGDPDGVFIFYMGSTATSLTTAVGSNVVLQGQAQACNVFWVVAGTATLFGDSTFRGNILASASITLGDNVTVDGRLLAQTGSVTLIHDTITRADCASGPGSATAPPTGSATAPPTAPPTGSATAPPTGSATAPPTGSATATPTGSATATPKASPTLPDTATGATVGQGPAPSNAVAVGLLLLSLAGLLFVATLRRRALRR